MINKKCLLGKAPEEVGMKDAVHVAIVSLRAGQALKPAQRITMNDAGEAISADSYAAKKKEAFGIVDPFRKSSIARGTNFWGVLFMDEIPTVRHDWTHPVFSFEPPVAETKKNESLLQIAEKLQVSYEDLMRACAERVETEEEVAYPGTLSEEDFDAIADSDWDYDLWSEWSEESGYEFENIGTECCPEHDYPGCPFKFVEKTD